MNVRACIIVAALASVTCAPLPDSPRAPTVAAITLRQGHPSQLGGLDGFLLFKRVEYEHGEGAATVGHVELVRGQHVTRFVSSVPGQAFRDGALLTMLAEGERTLTVQLDRPVIGKPFELFELTQVLLEGTPLQFRVDRAEASNLATMWFQFGVGDSAQHVALEISLGRSATVQWTTWTITVSQLRHHAAILTVNRIGSS